MEVEEEEITTTTTTNEVINSKDIPGEEVEQSNNMQAVLVQPTDQVSTTGIPVHVNPEIILTFWVPGKHAKQTS